MKEYKVSLAIAPIGWTNDDLPELGGNIPFEQCVSEMALAGFTGCEVGNKYPKDTEVLKRELGMRKLSICNAWFSTYLTTQPYEEVEKDFARHCDFLHTMGAKIVGVAEQGNSIQGKQDVPVFDAKPHFSDMQWNQVCAGLNRLGKVAQEKGLRLTYHHHMGTGIQTTAEIDRLMESTDPALVGLLFDSGHIAFSGEDPMATLCKWYPRIWHVHLKDVREERRNLAIEKKWSFLQGVKNGVFTIPGDGCVDFKPIFKELKDRGYCGWWVVEAEQDPAQANPLEYAMRARKFILDSAGI
ncbi:sugar phosphate isomerase/epimerase [Sphaerochaeta pleomorpha str. Grapes]|uniref:Sugar phosphate isomerase/epimerase n=1 Tax=Sphaerochaeta pleomorpha (strain ATCC BAA-1885 / DSM 22778 / Grapes) TaxID=158190 RepID=G8QZ22_SPHPG|nr:myo-inosose-2 dehydratase [Sphaerochaeta pleomorpha]AEV30881.1 sugar phosphate isomerase/epimerase [Sphaerochaeta pleomorpha str. Grapes]